MEFRQELDVWDWRVTVDMERCDSNLGGKIDRAR